MFPRRSGNARLRTGEVRGALPPEGGSGEAFAPPEKQGGLEGHKIFKKIPPDRNWEKNQSTPN